MKTTTSYTPEFVEFIPENIKKGVLYISMQYATATHKCASGCGEKIVTPLSPTDWTLTFNGESVSLSPSIGNWGHPCRAHYLIKNNQVIWSNQMNNTDVRRMREYQAEDKQKYYDKKDAEKTDNKQSWFNRFLKHILR